MIAVLIPPGLASPMAFQRQAWPSQAPLLVPDQDAGTGADAGVLSGPFAPGQPGPPPGLSNPMAWQHPRPTAQAPASGAAGAHSGWLLLAGTPFAPPNSLAGYL